MINKYKFIFDENSYINGYYATEIDWDYEGQMANYPDASKGWTKFINGDFVEDLVKKEEILNEEQKQAEIAELKQYMKDTDYIWNVIKEGDATEEDYADVIAQRHETRLRVRELEG